MTNRYLSLFLFILFIYSWLFCHYRPIVDPDTYYHALAARELNTIGKFSVEKFLPFSIFATYPNDQHYGFHLLQSIFSDANNLTHLLELQALLVGTLLIYFLNYAKKLNPQYALWAIVMLCANFGFICRISIIKATPLSALLYLGFINALYFENLLTIMLLPAIFALCHSGFIICFFPLLAFSICRPNKSIAAILLTLAGMIIGISLHPDGFNYLRFIKYQGIDIALLENLADKIEIGQEWAAPKIKTVILSNFPILLVALPIITAQIYKFNKQNFKQNFLLINCVLIFFLYLRSARFIEYFIPSILLYLLSAMQISVTTNKRIILPSTIFALCWCVVSTKFILLNNKDTMPKEMLTWIDTTVEKNSMICNLDFIDFPELAFNLPNYKYLYGSDPRYLAFAKPALYDELALFLKKPNQEQFIKIKEKARCQLTIISNKMPEAYLFLKDSADEKIEFKDYLILANKDKI